MVHIHITGASGSGTTSLGLALAEEMDILHLDADDFFWLPTDPPFTTPRSRDERTALLLKSAQPERGLDPLRIHADLGRKDRAVV